MTTIGATAMNLQIRDPRARELAERLAKKRNVSMTEAVIEALEEKLSKEEQAETPLQERVMKIVDRLHAIKGGEGRDMTKDEIDEMWGH
ncbi:type II toxin-antitoxin system VapB family antitoxin [Neorhizobium sp. SHOUNA12B]|nr:type II toxin-antitoxin system VapB family antitoxin [Neorhizobium sp. SHOUNA12B]